MPPDEVSQSAAQLAYRLLAFDREGGSAGFIVAAAPQPRCAALRSEFTELPQFDGQLLVQKGGRPGRLSNIATRVPFDRKVRGASHTQAAAVENVGAT